MEAASFWVERARRTVARRRERYGVDAPEGVRNLVAEGAATLSAFGALRLMVYVLIGQPSLLVALLWRWLTDLDTPARRHKAEALAGELAPRLSAEARVLAGSFERGLYRRDLARVPKAVATGMFRSLPAVVAQPRTEADVCEAMRFAAESGLCVYPRGISSSAFGGAIPTTNGLVLDLSAMAEVLEVDEDAPSARVQPGVRWGELASRLEPLGLAPVTTPSSRFSTVGGWASTGGMGIEGYKHGPFAEALLGGRVVLANGEVLDLEEGDPRLADLVGSEGQLGVFTELRLRLRPRVETSRPRILYFASPEEAFEAVSKLETRAAGPAHVVYFDRAHMAEEEAVAMDRHGRELGLFERRDALLLAFDDEASEARFLEAFPEADERGEATLPRSVAARYLWSDRFFPLKGQRLGPSVLASETVVPPSAMPRFVRAARRLGGLFGVEVGIEGTLCREGEGQVSVTIASFPCDRERRVDYMVKLVLVQLLTHLGVRLGGRPYGVGIWNSAFLPRRHPPERIAALRARKAELDPESRLNPRKFFGLRTRFLGLPGLAFVPWIQGLGLWLLLPFAPLVGALSRLLGREPTHGWEVPPPEEGRRLLAESATRCTLCGSCVAVCPAYALTRDEQVTGRSKLQLGEALATGGDVSAAEAWSPVQCFRCGLCEEVCQTSLPLRDCYLALEDRVAARFVDPADTAARFAARVDEERSWLMRTFGLDLPSWRPGEVAKRVESPARDEAPEVTP